LGEKVDNGNFVIPNYFSQWTVPFCDLIEFYRGEMGYPKYSE